MIDITMYNDNNNFELSVEGHAEYAEIGKDIVCAGISAITSGVIKALERSNAAIEISEGNAHIQLLYSDSMYDYVQGIYDVADGGYTMIAENYPEYADYNPLG